LTTPTDSEIFYLARCKLEPNPIVTIREITKYKLTMRQIDNQKRLLQFLADATHPNLLKAWGCFWDQKNVYVIHEPVTDQISLQQIDLKSVLL
jgi:hypothetical protein